MCGGGKRKREKWREDRCLQAPRSPARALRQSRLHKPDYTNRGISAIQPRYPHFRGKCKVRTFLGLRHGNLSMRYGLDEAQKVFASIDTVARSRYQQSLCIIVGIHAWVVRNALPTYHNIPNLIHDAKNQQKCCFPGTSCCRLGLGAKVVVHWTTMTIRSRA